MQLTENKVSYQAYILDTDGQLFFFLNKSFQE